MKYKLFIAAALCCISGFCAINLTQPASAAITCPDDAERKSADNIAQCYLPENETDKKGKEKDLIWYIQATINVILGCVGIIAVVTLIIGGISFITSQGDPGKVAKARNTILYSIVGIIVALLAFAIVNFVLDSIFGKTKTPASTPPATTNSQS